MEVFSTIVDVRHALREERRRGRSVAFVPTMGYLHEGHVALMREGRKRANILVVSIFVNPTQFGPSEDLDAYPRDLESDLAKCRGVGAHVVFTPTPAEMYQGTPRTTVTVEGLTQGLCGRSRPTHFQGVTTVVTKLFNIVQPDVAIFGEKDYQQLAVLRQMARDLNTPVEIIGAPTVREPDGLAMSSRNAYLSPDQRQQATVLIRSLRQVHALVAQGEQDVGVLDREVRGLLDQEPDARLDYLSFVHPDTLEPVDTVSAPTRVAMAVFLGPTRLIDNILVTPGAP